MIQDSFGYCFGWKKYRNARHGGLCRHHFGLTRREAWKKFLGQDLWNNEARRKRAILKYRRQGGVVFKVRMVAL